MRFNYDEHAIQTSNLAKINFMLDYCVIRFVGIRCFEITAKLVKIIIKIIIIYYVNFLSSKKIVISVNKNEDCRIIRQKCLWSYEIN